MNEKILCGVIFYMKRGRKVILAETGLELLVKPYDQKTRSANNTENLMTILNLKAYAGRIQMCADGSTKYQCMTHTVHILKYFEVSSRVRQNCPITILC